MRDDQVEALRRFNREFTQHIGVLEDRYLGLDGPLGEARLLFEVGPDGAAVLDLRSRLGLDSGYTSRLLRSLEAKGLLEVHPDPEDGRRRRAVLTEAGVTAWEQLDQRSDTLVRELLSSLTERQREELGAALTTVGQLLRVAKATFEVVSPAHPWAAAALREYYRELDELFPTGFDLSEPTPEEVAAFRAPDGAFVVVRAADETAGCGALQTLSPGLGEIKRMWIAPQYRGTGLGRRLLAELEARARELGHDRVRLDTNAVLSTAAQLYESAGYTPIARYNDNPYAHHWFEKAL